MRAVVLALAAGVFWGVGEVCTKSVLHTHRIGPLTAIALRSAIALPVLAAAWWWATRIVGTEPREVWRNLSVADLFKLVAGSGLAAGAGGMICFYAALSLGDVSRIKPIAFTVAPAIGAVLGWLLLREPMGPRKALALAMILGGVLLLTASGPKPARSSGPGEPQQREAREEPERGIALAAGAGEIEGGDGL